MDSHLHVTIELAPVHNVLNSMALLHRIDVLPASSAWVRETAAALNSTQLWRNRVFFDCLRGALLPAGDWSDFPAYLDALKVQPSTILRDRTAHWFEHAPVSAVSADARALLADPAALHETAVSHLYELWEGYLAAEWQRISSALAHQVALLSNDQHLPAATAAMESLLQPDIDDGDDTVVTQRIYVPSAHTGRYVIALGNAGQQRIYFEAPRSFPAIMRSAPIGDSELLSRLAALSDETRLQILELFAAQDVVTTQEIIARLNLSQSLVSRQIKPLQHYLIESRGQGANKHYQFSPAQLELTFQAARERLNRRTRAIPFDDVRLQQPELLRRYMDAQGLLMMLPHRQQERAAALEVIAAQFTPGRDYTEQVVNAIISAQIAFDDFVTLRRELVNARLLNREPDGSRYWKGDKETRRRGDRVTDAPNNSPTL